MNQRNIPAARPRNTQTLAWLQALFSQLDHMVSVVDFDGRIVQANRTMSEFLGAEPGTVEGTLLWDWLRASYGSSTENLFREAIRMAKKGTTQSAELQLAGDLQKARALVLTIKPFDANQAETFLLIEGKDITRQKLAEESLQASEHLLTTAMVGAPIMLFVVDQSGIIRLAAGKGALSLRETIRDPHGKSIFDVYARFPSVIRNYERAMAGETVEERLQLDQLTFAAHYTPMVDGSGKIVGVIGVHTDITQQIRTEAALEDSHIRFDTVFQSAGIGIALKDKHSRYIKCNPAFLAMLNTTQDELEQVHESEITHPDDREIDAPAFQQLVAGEIDRYTIEKRFITKDNRILWAHVTLTCMPYRRGEQLIVVQMIKDITARKEMETELQEVQHRLIEAAEQERLRLAQDLHDGPLQDMISLNFNLQTIEMIEQSQEAKGEVQAAQRMVQQISQRIRAICSDLRPPALAPFGLEKALRSHAESFQIEHPEFTLKLDLAPDGQSLAEPTRLVLYRIYQEALKNVLRHAEAKTIWVRYRIDERQAVLEIQDDGKGFHMPKRWVSLARRGHLGLVGAAERAESVGGYLDVESSPTSGTLIRAIIPCNLQYNDQVRNDDESYSSPAGR